MDVGGASKPLGVLVVGSGQMGVEHIHNIALLPSAVVVAVADPHEPSRARAEALRAKGLLPQHARVVEDFRAELRNDDVEAVVVCTPNHTHLQVVTEVVNAGKHVLVEKPLCTTMEDCRALQALVEGKDLVVWVGMEYRYMKPIARLITEVESGTVGELRMVAIREHRYPFLTKVGDWNRFSENTGGTMVEKCCHFFDLMVRIARSQPVSVYCSAAQDVNHKHESFPAHGNKKSDIIDNAFAIVNFANGTRASLDLCMFAERSRNQEEVSAVGSRGKVEALIPESVVHIGRRSIQPDDVITTPPEEEEGGGVERVSMPVDPKLKEAGYHEGSTFFELSKFVQAVRSGTPAEVGVRDGVLAVAMGLAAERSAREQRVVLMSEVLGNDEAL